MKLIKTKRLCCGNVNNNGVTLLKDNLVGNEMDNVNRFCKLILTD